ncbi:MAG: acyl carrier protein [Hyphomicrobiales bacterium]|nr:acyl carrier protein [Hyphomicrobiales bacterium]
MLDQTRVDDRVLAMVREFAPALPGDADRARNVDLRSAGLTSVAAVKLMLAIEAAFDIAIPDADLTPENFGSVTAIEALVDRLRG